MPEFQLTPRNEKSCRYCPQAHAPNVTKQVTTEHYGSTVDVMFIAEAPGASEDAQGRPFIGRTGRVLRRIVEDINGGMQGIALGNIVRCRPTRKKNAQLIDRPPTKSEVKACRSGILRDIMKLRPKQLVLCGDTSAHALASNLDGSLIGDKRVLQMRGRDFVVKLPDGTEVPAIVTYHFAYVFRQPTLTSIFRDDIARAIRRAKGQLSDYSARGPETVLVQSVDRVKALLRHMLHNLDEDDVVAIDYETRSLRRIDNAVLCLGFAWDNEKSFVVPLDHPETPFSPDDLKTVRQLLKRFFSIQNPPFHSFVAHNAKFECLATLDQLKTHIRGPLEDTQQRAHILNEDRKKASNKPYRLKELVEEHLGFYHYHDADIVPVVRAREAGRLYRVDINALAQYNGMDAYVTHRLYEWQNRWAQLEGFFRKFSNVSMHIQGRVARFLAEIERNGFLIDIKQVRKLAAPDSPVAKRQLAILEELKAMPSVAETNRLLSAKRKYGTGIWGKGVKELFDFGETESKRALFFEVLKLKPVKFSRKTHTPSVGKELFERYQGVPEIDLYAEYTGLQRIRSTYIEGIYKFLHPKEGISPDDPINDMRDHRLRSSYWSTGTITGRLSASEPNALNVPSRKKDEASKSIKRIYFVDWGRVLVCADYSQAEVRWLAEATGDKRLIKALREAYRAKLLCRGKANPTPEEKAQSKRYGDVHYRTAALMYGIDIEKVTPEQRSAIKAITFGLVYGMGIDSLAVRLQISKNEAEKLMEAFFARFPDAEKWLNRMEKIGFRKCRVFSPLGRRKLVSSRYLIGDDNVREYPEYLSYLRGHLNHEMRVCRNAPIQGTASDMTLMACCKLLDYILKHNLNWLLVNTVYDSIMVDVPFDGVARCVKVLQHIMESPKLFAPFGIKPRVPFAADFTAGLSWGDQIEIAYDEESWTVKCLDCKKERSEKSRPTNRRCEECGSKHVTQAISAGPLKAVLKQLATNIEALREQQ